MGELSRALQLHGTSWCFIVVLPWKICEYARIAVQAAKRTVGRWKSPIDALTRRNFVGFWEPSPRADSQWIVSIWQWPSPPQTLWTAFATRCIMGCHRHILPWLAWYYGHYEDISKYNCTPVLTGCRWWWSLVWILLFVEGDRQVGDDEGAADHPHGHPSPC